jgi:hypothetical protein
MTTATDTIEVSMADRRILAAGLASLVRELGKEGRGDAISENVDRLMTVLAATIPTVPTPRHVDFKQSEYLGLMAVLPVSDSWRLFWEKTEGYVSDNSHALVAEVTLGADDWRFDLARNLRGTGRFLELDPFDLSFCHLIEEQMRLEAGQSAQIIHEVIDIPLPWDFLPDESTDNRIEKYLESVGAVDYPPAIHSTFVDVHPNIELAQLYFASVMTEVSGFEDELAHLKEGIEEHIQAIVQQTGVRPS